jgi:hypothetical protein
MVFWLLTGEVLDLRVGSLKVLLMSFLICSCIETLRRRLRLLRKRNKNMVRTIDDFGNEERGNEGEENFIEEDS